MKKKTHNINNNGSEANENFNNKKKRIENIEDKQKAYALMSIPRHNLPESEKAIYDKVISTAIQNINNGVGMKKDFRLKKKYTMVYKACNLNNVSIIKAVIR